MSPRLKQIIRTLGVIGPAVLISVELFDPASIVTATASGSALGFEVLWAAFYSGILLIIVEEISARLGVVTRKTLAENIHRTYGRNYSSFLFVTYLFLDLSTLTAEIIGLSLALSFLFKIPYILGVLATISLTVFLVFLGSYSKVEKTVIFLATAVFLVYAYLFVQLNPSYTSVIFSSIVPSMSGKSLYYAEALIGASIMPTYVVLHSGLVFEKGLIHDHHRGLEELVRYQHEAVVNQRIDSIISLLMGTILNIVIIATAAILVRGRQIETFLDIALPFYDRLGNIGVILFGVAFACAGISAVITVGLGSVYNSFGFLGIEERIKAKRFRLLFILWVIVAAVFSLLPNQIEIMVFTQYLNGALLPFVLVPLLLLARNQKIMGGYKLGKTVTTLALATIIIVTSLFLLSLPQVLK